MEETNQLEPRLSALEDDMDEEDMDEDDEDMIKKVKTFSVYCFCVLFCELIVSIVYKTPSLILTGRHEDKSRPQGWRT